MRKRRKRKKRKRKRSSRWRIAYLPAGRQVADGGLFFCGFRVKVV